MKRLTKTLFAFGFAYAITATSLFAQIYTFDEYGNSTGPGISPGLLQADPSGGLAVPVLVYNVPIPLVTGDLVLIEAGQPANAQYSDVVRFWDPTGGNLSQIIFYSDQDETTLAPADTGLPSIGNLINPVFINEVGPEGNNGAVWSPPAGAPGSSLPGVAVQYNIISDGVVPEPSSLALLMGGLGVLIGINRFRQKGLPRKGQLELLNKQNPMKKIILLTAAFAAVSLVTAKADILADWTFETSQPGVLTLPASPGAGVAFPGFSPEIGSGTASGLHVGAATYSSPSGNGSFHSFSSTLWAVGDYYQFEVNTLGYSGIKLSFDQTSSNTGPRGYDLDYSTDGVNFYNFTSYTVLANASPNTPWNASTYNSAYTFSDDLSAVSALNNQSTVFFRLVDNSTVSASGGTVGTLGTDRVDNFVVSAAPVPEPATSALCVLGGLVCLVARRLRF